MKVIRHQFRTLVNMSHAEAEALSEVVERGLIDIYDDTGTLSTGARKALAYWLPNKKTRRIRNPLKPRKASRASRKAADGPERRELP